MAGKKNKNKNKSLSKAKKAKNDEFYTSYEDVKRECDKYSRFFKDKVIYCNCDDHYGIQNGSPKSNFVKYFADFFEAWKMKKLIATHYDKGASTTKMYILERDVNGDGHISSVDIEEKDLNGDGDFRSPECVQLLQEADIVITNPAFSLFREFIALLMKYKKKFLVIGPDNCRTYKEVFPLIKSNKIWTGLHHVKEFLQPNGTKKEFGNISWYTNLPNSKRNDELFTGKKYYGYEHMYPKYDNYDAINVDRVRDIPDDYDGVMGVPITFLDSYNPKQFEIIGQGQGDLYRKISDNGLSQKFVDDYYASGQTGSIKEDHPVLGYYDNNRKPIIPYMRILIRRIKKAPEDTEQQEKGV